MNIQKRDNSVKSNCIVYTERKIQMKRLISLLLVFCCMVSCTAITSCAVAKTYGDVNEDTTVDIVDVASVRANIVGSIELEGKALLLADVNHDEVVDIVDVVLMRNAIVNGTELDPWGENDTENDVNTDAGEDVDTEENIDTEVVLPPEVAVVTDTLELEFEDGKYRGTLNEQYGHNGKSVLFESDGHNATVEFTVATTDNYKVTAYMISPFGDKVCNLEFDVFGKSSYGISKGNDPVPYEIFNGTLEAGRTYKVKARPNWTFVFADYVVVEKAEPGAEVEINLDRTLTNENATEEAKALYNYICDVYGNNILTAQQESIWMDEGNVEYEMEYIEENTGKLPAIRGLDFMNDDFDGCVQRAKAWHEKGGIVTIMWHCGPYMLDGYKECMNKTIADWDALFTPGTEEYDKLMAGFDKGAEALLELQDAGIPVIWRPFHELDGGWFWWSKGGADNLAKLWRAMYDRYTNYWGLNNLIWTFGYSQNGVNYAAWYPGDEYVDIAGADSYNGGSEPGLFKQVVEVVGGKKPVCFHECGTAPTVEQLTTLGTKWAWFMIWHSGHLTDQNNKTDLSALYNSDYAITLDELPDIYAGIE